jgi:GNAT superfamily N-acetyltransferase
MSVPRKPDYQRAANRPSVRGESSFRPPCRVTFWGAENDGALVGVMSLQPARDVDLIRHGYVLPASQRQGIGGVLLRFLGN